MDRRKFGAVLDEAVGQLESDVRILKTQQATITANLKELETKRDKLSQEIADGEQRLSGVQKEYKGQVDTMLKSAQEKLNKANAKDAEASSKVAELSEKSKEADGIIKSNQGLQKNLNIQNETATNIIAILKGLINTIQKTLKDI